MRRTILVVILLTCIMTRSSIQNKIQKQDKKPVVEYHVFKSFPYPMLKWNNRLYRITSYNVSNVGDFLGEIIYSPISLIEPNNSTSYFPNGTKLYLIPGIKPTEAVAYGTSYKNIYGKAIAHKINK
ncbi:hypothetical protein [Paenibacillus sp. LPE1-1-1.1]|uniref:hypothetical protein n=1 Tax=Paenibacillus sp. LPE1-1-1.1 TaxID=3135230 RepID=UPI0034301A81